MSHQPLSTAKSNTKQRKPSLPKGVYRRKVKHSTYFLVSLGRDEKGKQRWKSCPTLEEAITERQLFEHTKKQQGESLWTLPPEKRADAVAALDVLKDYPGETLVTAASFYLKYHLSLTRTQRISELVDRFIDKREAAGVSLGTLRNLRCRLKPLKELWGNRLANEVTVEDVESWDADMRRRGLSPMSRRHYLNHAGSFYRWAIANRFAVSTPLDPLAVTRPRIRRGSIRFFDVEQSKQILCVFSKHGLRNYTVLGLFCGIRPEETRRLRKQHFKFDGDRIVITLDADVTKTVWRRVIELPRGTPLGDAMWAWFGGNGKVNLPEQIAPSLATWRRRFRKIRKELGFPWVNDGMRHTAATYHYALGRDETATSALLGHTTPTMLQTHYKGLTTEAEAKRFYALRPE